MPKVNAKLRSGQVSGQNPGVTSDAVAQEANGHIRAGILLNREHHVQGGPAQDVHHSGPVARAQAAVVFPELHVQNAVQAVLPPRGSPPVTADQSQQGLGIHGPARDAVAHGTLSVARAVAFRAHQDQAAQAGLRDRVCHPLAEAETVQVRRSRRPPLRLTVSQRSCTSGVKVLRSASLKARAPLHTGCLGCA